jgi:hypothetical protein
MSSILGSNLHKLVLQWVARKEVDAVLSVEAFQRAATSALQVDLPTASMIASNSDLTVGEECWKTDLNTTMGEGARSLDCVVARSLPKALAAMWKVHRLREILPKTSWLLGYSENPDRVMFNNIDSNLNAKDKFTCELSTHGVNVLPGVVGRGNGGGGPYGEWSCCKKSLVTQLNNI